MRKIRSLNNAIFARIVDAHAPWIIPTLARFTFAATLLWFFWYSALTKIGEGFFGFLNPTAGAFAGVLPWRAEAVGFDPAQYTFLDTAVVVLGMWAEFVLPFLVVIGLFTRAASLAMIGFVTVLTLVDIFGHKVEPATIGKWFDGGAGSVILDQRLFWLLLLVTLVLKGAGAISVDRLFRIT